MMHNSKNKFKRYSKNNNYKKNRRFGGGSSSHIEEEFINPQQRRNFENKRDQHLMKAKEYLSAGERIEAENHFQHAEHYHRMANIGLDKIQQQQQSHQQNSEGEAPEGENNNFEDNNGENAPEIPVDSVGSFPQSQPQLNQQQQPRHNPQQREKYQQPRQNQQQPQPTQNAPENNLSSLPFMQPIREAE